MSCFSAGAVANVSVLSVNDQMDQINRRATSNSCEIDQRTIKTAGAAFFAQNGEYATSNAQLVADGFLSTDHSWDYEVTGSGEGNAVGTPQVRLTGCSLPPR